MCNRRSREDGFSYEGRGETTRRRWKILGKGEGGRRKYKAKLKKNHRQQNSNSMLTRTATNSNTSDESVLFCGLLATDSVKSPE